MNKSLHTTIRTLESRREAIARSLALILRGRLALVGLVVGVEVFPVQAAGITFTNWTSVNTTTNVAVGTLGPVAVSLSGGDINSGITDGSFTGFNHPFFTPPLVSSDEVEFFGPNPPSTDTYTVAFSTPVMNPRLHIGSLASTLTFSTVLTRLSGQADFVVVDNTVTGALHNTADPTDSNGTVELAGTFSSFTFTAQALGVFFHGGDGISLQIGADISSVTPTDTPIPPTDTPTNTPVIMPTQTPTNTPTATDTPTTSPTRTLTSTPTDTPTNTPVPPTDTPVPPTDTPVPPTATPTPTATHTPTNTPLVGSGGCPSVQLAVQQAVSAGRPYRNHGALVSTAARAVSRAVTAGQITDGCAGCIINQFARGVPIAEQRPCGVP